MRTPQARTIARLVALAEVVGDRLAFVSAVFVGTTSAAVAFVPFIELLRDSFGPDVRARAASSTSQPRYFLRPLLPVAPHAFEIETAFLRRRAAVMLAVSRFSAAQFAGGRGAVRPVRRHRPRRAALLLPRRPPARLRSSLPRRLTILTSCASPAGRMGLDDLVRCAERRSTYVTVAAACWSCPSSSCSPPASRRYGTRFAVDIAWTVARAPSSTAPPP